MEKQVQVMTAKIRRENWIKIIEDRNRSGLTVKDWCFQNHVNETSYYYWLKKIRESIINETSEQEMTFIPLLPVEQKKSSCISASENKAASPVVIRTGEIIIELGNNATQELILNLVRALKNA